MKTLGIDRISPSSIKLYEDCPKSFYYAVWLGLKLPQETVHFAFGNAIHLAIENIYNQMDKDTLWELSEIKLVKDVFLANFNLTDLNKDMVKLNGEKTYPTEASRVAKFEEMRNDGIEIIKSYWDKKEWLLATYGINPVKFEISVRVAIKNPKTGEVLEVPISCRLDAENEDGKIIEMKTSKEKYDENETRNLPQALTYPLVKFMQTGKIPKLTYIIMLKGKKGKDRIQVLEYEYQEEDMLAFISRVKGILGKIKNREFERSTVDHPPFCDCIKFDQALDVTIK